MNHVGDIILNEEQVSLQLLEVLNKETCFGSSTLLFNFMILYYFRCCSFTQITFLGCSSISFVLLVSGSFINCILDLPSIDRMFSPRDSNVFASASFSCQNELREKQMYSLSATLFDEFVFLRRKSSHFL